MSIPNHQRSKLSKQALMQIFFRQVSYKMFREGEGRVVVRLLRDAEIQAINLEKVSQEQAEIYNARIKVRNELKVCPAHLLSS